MLTSTELVSHVGEVGAVVDGKFAEHTVTKVNIDDLVVLASCKYGITSILRGLSDTCSISLSRLLGSLARVLNLTDLVPFVLSVAPHVRKSHIIFLENLDKAIGFALDASFDLFFEVW